MNILVTGGAGYIGSHAALRLLEDGHAVTVVDDLSRGNRAVIDVLKPLGDLEFVEAGVGDRRIVVEAMRRRSVELVMHFAALAYVGESVQQPLRYYRQNTAASLALLEAMEEAGVRRIVFSSTCATYGEPPPAEIPIRETCPQRPINPYGRSKLMVEHMLFDHAAQKREAGEDFAFAALRYFNVAGNDRRARIGEDHKPETHLIPICLEVALGQREHITIYGTDYDTPDGTCIRDYVHVEDLIDAHVTAMRALRPGDARTYNVGIGRGYSVREVIEASRRVTGVDFPAVEGQRRAGDPPTLYNDPTKVSTELGWTARVTDLDEIIETAWRWRSAHPDGYA
ncbi:MAG: UDP-glucose 4-epimerase GalE [Planctomycetota bacterium]|jgi:UDP-glucose 4-epimerase